MLYHGDNPIKRIIGVEYMTWEAEDFLVAPRTWSALAFRLKGTATIRYGERTCVIDTNDVLYLPQQLGYSASYTDTEMIVIHFETARPDPDLEIYSLHNTEALYKLFLRANTRWMDKAPGYEIYVLGCLYEILGTIFEKETKTHLPPAFADAMSCLNQNFRDSNLTIGRVCEIAGISQTVFRQLFRRYYQKTPVEYVIGLRTEHARNLIAGGAAIEAAAYESGFNDPKYFARVIKQQFGCTPRELKTYGK